MRETQAEPQLPANVANFGMTVQKSPTAPMMLVALYSPQRHLRRDLSGQLRLYQPHRPITRVPGIAQVHVFGAGQYAMRIWVKPDQLAKLGSPSSDMISAVQAQNTVNPAGQIGGEPRPPGQEFTYTVRAQGRLTTPEEFGDIVIRDNPGRLVVRVKDVARIELGRPEL